MDSCIQSKGDTDTHVFFSDLCAVGRGILYALYGLLGALLIGGWRVFQGEHLDSDATVAVVALLLILGGLSETTIYGARHLKPLLIVGPQGLLVSQF